MSEKVKCYHCGDDCEQELIVLANKHFCCEGCKMVFEILDANGMCSYYNIENNPGIKLKAQRKEKFAYLDDLAVQQQLLQFQDNNITKVTFSIPQMHCASCIWLLENLYKLKPGLVNSIVDFIRKEVTITFWHKQISMRQVVELMASIGYEPQITLDKKAESRTSSDKMLYYRLGVAGFCFGNIMLLSFPEYLSAGSYLETSYSRFFAYVNLMLGLPVFFFSSSIYFRSAWTSLKRFQLNLDVPLALGVLILFARSVYEILSQTGAGYMDSLAGLVFFLLIGRWFQGRTYERLSFERDYTSYFPIAVTRLINQQEEMVTLTKLEPDDIILVRNQELIPADSILVSGDANINYSFVTGETQPVNKSTGELIYAGGSKKGITELPY